MSEKSSWVMYLSGAAVALAGGNLYIYSTISARSEFIPALKIAGLLVCLLGVVLSWYPRIHHSAKQGIGCLMAVIGFGLIGSVKFISSPLISRYLALNGILFFILGGVSSVRGGGWRGSK